MSSCVSKNTSYTGVMRFHDRRFIFTAGQLCVDFAHTGGSGAYAKFERLNAPEDLVDWFALCSPKLLVEQAGKKDLLEARALRDAIWKSAWAVIANQEIAAEQVETLNRFAAEPAPAPELVGLKWAWRSDLSATHGFSAIARDAIELFGSDRRDRLRECANPECALLLVDISRPGKRKWCTMQRCGNLKKTARYRKKKREQEAEERKT